MNGIKPTWERPIVKYGDFDTFDETNADTSLRTEKENFSSDANEGGSKRFQKGTAMYNRTTVFWPISYRRPEFVPNFLEGHIQKVRHISGL